MSNECKILDFMAFSDAYKAIKGVFSEGIGDLINNAAGAMVYEILKPIFDAIDAGVYATEELMQQGLSVVDDILATIDMNRWILAGLSNNAKDALALANRELAIISYMKTNLRLMKAIGERKPNRYWIRISERINSLLKRIDRLLIDSFEDIGHGNFVEARDKLQIAEDLTSLVLYYCNPNSKDVVDKLKAAGKAVSDTVKIKDFKDANTVKIKDFRDANSGKYTSTSIRHRAWSAIGKTADKHYKKANEDARQEAIKQVRVLKYYFMIVLLYAGKDYVSIFEKIEQKLIDISEGRGSEGDSYKEIFSAVGKVTSALPALMDGQSLKYNKDDKWATNYFKSVPIAAGAIKTLDMINGVGVSTNYDQLTFFGAQFFLNNKLQLISGLLAMLTESYSKEDYARMGESEELKSKAKIDNYGGSFHSKAMISPDNASFEVIEKEPIVFGMLRAIRTDLRSIGRIATTQEQDRFIADVKGMEIDLSFDPLGWGKRFILDLGIAGVIPKLLAFDAKIIDTIDGELEVRRKSLKALTDQLSKLQFYKDDEIDVMLSMLESIGLGSVASSMAYGVGKIYQAGSYAAMFGSALSAANTMLRDCFNPKLDAYTISYNQLYKNQQNLRKTAANASKIIHKGMQELIDGMCSVVGIPEGSLDKLKKTQADLKAKSEAMEATTQKLKILAGYASLAAKYGKATK